MTILLFQATGSRLAVLIQSFGSITYGIIIGFIYSWKLTLVVLGFAPLMLVTSVIKMRIVYGSQGHINKKMEQAAKVMIGLM
jgi:ABC-type bacteriocin/lantibiotic exporter with double-glycine peptidase domain